VILKIALISVAAAPLLACTAAGAGSEIPEKGATPGKTCKADDLQVLVGEQANANTGQVALKRSGGKILRWIPPNSAVTMDYRQDRLNISYNEDMAITKVNCG